jgi:[acyl-carrier-protein] S-malonyltransferase
VNAQPYPSDEQGIHQLLVDQVVSPVLWEDCVKSMIQAGAEVFLEVGPGKVLTGLLRRIDRKAVGIGISDLQSIRAFVEGNP